MQVILNILGSFTAPNFLLREAPSTVASRCLVSELTATVLERYTFWNCHLVHRDPPWLLGGVRGEPTKGVRGPVLPTWPSTDGASSFHFLPIIAQAWLCHAVPQGCSGQAARLLPPVGLSPLRPLSLCAMPCCMRLALSMPHFSPPAHCSGPGGLRAPNDLQTGRIWDCPRWQGHLPPPEVGATIWTRERGAPLHVRVVCTGRACQDKGPAVGEWRAGLISCSGDVGGPREPWDAGRGALAPVDPDTPSPPRW